MEATTYQEVQGLSRMTVGELREKHLEVFGEETRSYHKEFLRKRIAWRSLPLPPRPGPGQRSRSSGLALCG
jgi:hypothetical protein